MLYCCYCRGVKDQNIGVLLKNVSKEKLEEMMAEGPVFLKGKAHEKCDCRCHK